ncbi:glycerophosphodiester phosphodiesterase [Iamia sp. SCSIO 61187]|uniref:glycerophosphodiester phosphodiesterase n=1 Tax=Iamia sp. SCSIO 61187 TaxID=2722752 RepID=UPI0021069974|nr:glycerophosphodiester phosphodiesterase [Iamia sp. SCSIO 61187]QYG92856.1 glycerophosphodiester phosphodiesterase [Iamia sp. SCSIO 61187]
MGSTWGFLEHAGPLAFAHRGAHRAEGPGENTLAAFAAAVDLGYRYLETDVHLTADGVVVAFHDDHLDRVTDRAGAISDLSWAEVQRARVGPDGDPVPRLDEILSTWPDVRVNIDPKHDRVVDALAEVIEAQGAVDRVCCGSFSDKRLARLRTLLGPSLCTSLGPRGTAKLAAAAKGAPVRSLVAPCAQVPQDIKGRRLVTPRFVETAHRLGVQVHVWTIDDPAEMTALLDMGVDGLMTDQAETLKQVLTDRGEWV